MRHPARAGRAAARARRALADVHWFYGTPDVTGPAATDRCGRCGSRRPSATRPACAATLRPRPAPTTTCSTSRPTTTSAWPATRGSRRRQRPPRARGAPGRPARGWSPAAPSCTPSSRRDLAAFVGRAGRPGLLLGLPGEPRRGRPRCRRRARLVVSDAHEPRLARRRLPARPGRDVVVTPHRDVGRRRRGARRAHRRSGRSSSPTRCSPSTATSRRWPRCTPSPRAHGALLVVDEAHALGVVGPDGRGAAARGRASPASPTSCSP